MAREVGDLDKISAIEIATTRRGYEQTGRDAEKWTPDTRDTADHSLPYITARAMFDGDISNDSYAQDKIAIRASAPSCARSRSMKTRR